MKTTTLTRHNICEGMILLSGKDKFYVQEVSHNNDDSTIVRGNYSDFGSYPSISSIYYDNDRVKIVLED